jgi:choline dehydrogenase
MDGQFDYVIIGAGSAGCTLAYRLARAGRRVALLEAGPSDRRFFVQMPLGYGKLFFDPAVNWSYRTEPDPGLAGQSDYWPRGRVLGGSSAINAMVWCRGHRADYDEWQAAGNPGWGWDAALAGYRQIEDAATPGLHRGQGGPLRIRAGRAEHRLVDPFLAACASAGLPLAPDLNTPEPEGVGTFELTIAGGRRNSAARAFLRPALATGQVALRTGAQVTRLLHEGGRVIGATYLWRGAEHRIMGGETILAGGAINSPQLLMLSGIGPAADLSALGIPVLRDLPAVGANLSDHQGINYTWRMRVPTLNDRLRPWWGKALAGAQWLLTGSGPLGASINHGGGFFRTDPGRARPNMQLYFQAFSTLIPREGERPVLSPDPFPGLSIGLSNCRPTSTGQIHLASPDPLAAPRIAMRAYATNADVVEMLAAVKWLRRIAASAPFAALVDQELRPGPEIQSDDDLIADFRLRSGTVYHPSCTCRMGPDPASSVVDADLRVHGVPGLRVCDASVFPNLIAGNTNAPAILVGWLGAERMLATTA